MKSLGRIHLTFLSKACGLSNDPPAAECPWIQGQSYNSFALNDLLASLLFLALCSTTTCGISKSSAAPLRDKIAGTRLARREARPLKGRALILQELIDFQRRRRQRYENDRRKGPTPS
jgi:hypothetical protein